MNLQNIKLCSLAKHMLSTQDKDETYMRGVARAPTIKPYHLFFHFFIFCKLIQDSTITILKKKDEKSPKTNVL